MSDKNTSCISSKPLTRPSSQPPRHTVHPESGHCSCTKRHLTPAHHRALPVSPWAFRQTPQRPGLGPVQVIQLNSLLYFFTSETGPLKRSFCFKELHGGSKGGNRKKRVRGMRERDHPPTNLPSRWLQWQRPSQIQAKDFLWGSTWVARPRAWAVLGCLPRPLARSWTRGRAASTLTGAY